MRLLAALLLLASPALWAANRSLPDCQAADAWFAIRIADGFELFADNPELQRYFDHCAQPGILPMLKPLAAQAEEIRNVAPGDQRCYGTYQREFLPRYWQRLSLTTIAPRLLAKARPRLPEPAMLQNYLSNWALRSPSNYVLYQAFVQSRRDVQPQLAGYYQAQFGLTADEATLSADRALELITQWAAGAYPGAGREREPTARTTVFPLTHVLSAPDLNAEAFTQALAGKPATEELDQALKLALARELPLPMLTELVKQMDSLDSGDESALFFALHNPAAMALLLDHGAAVDYANGFGKTALYYAIESGNQAAATILLDHGADPNHTYKSAEQLKDLECLYKIEHTARTPLMHAAQHSDPAMLALLLHRGARPDAVDGLGWTAGDYAIHYKRSENDVFLAGFAGQ